MITHRYSPPITYSTLRNGHKTRTTEDGHATGIHGELRCVYRPLNYRQELVTSFQGDILFDLRADHAAEQVQGRYRPVDQGTDVARLLMEEADIADYNWEVEDIVADEPHTMAESGGLRIDFVEEDIRVRLGYVRR